MSVIKDKNDREKAEEKEVKERWKEGVYATTIPTRELYER
jgi:hypothetical protein